MFLFLMFLCSLLFCEADLVFVLSWLFVFLCAVDFSVVFLCSWLAPRMEASHWEELLNPVNLASTHILILLPPPLVIIILILSLHFDLFKDLQLFIEIWAKYKTCGITFPRLNCHSPPTYPGVFKVKHINLWDFQIKEITPACWLFDLQWASLNSFPLDSILR